jgi:hypothetical protein
MRQRDKFKTTAEHICYSVRQSTDPTSYFYYSIGISISFSQQLPTAPSSHETTNPNALEGFLKADRANEKTIPPSLAPLSWAGCKDRSLSFLDPLRSALVSTAEEASRKAELSTTLSYYFNKSSPCGVFSTMSHDASKFTGFDTIALHGGYEPDTSVVYGLGQGAPRGVPLHRTAPYLFKNTEHAANLFALKELGNIYTRLMNPTNHVLESRYALLEGGHPLSALAVASGTSAIFYAIINLASAGDNIISSSSLYGGTYTMFNNILPDLGITVRFVDVTNPNAFIEAADENTRAFFIESCSNPSLVISCIENIANAAHSIGLPLIVDSTFSTPYLTKPFEFGADIVANSLTKWIGGHGTCIGGILVDKGGFNWGAGMHVLCFIFLARKMFIIFYILYS